MEKDFFADFANVTPTKRSNVYLAARIDQAMLVVAKLLEEDDTYLPVFLRLEQEAAAIYDKEAALERAMQLIT